DFAPRGDDTLHIVLVAAGYQGLAQQRLACPYGTHHGLHLLGEVRHMMQLRQYRLALGGEKAKTRGASRKGIVVQLIVTQKIVGCAQVAHIHFRLINHQPATASTEGSAWLSKSAVTTASPKRLSSTRRSWPSSTFLSTAINCVKSAAAMFGGGAVGKPAAPINAVPRCCCAALIQPRAADSCNAMTMPAPTASPCSQVP